MSTEIESAVTEVINAKNEVIVAITDLNNDIANAKTEVGEQRDIILGLFGIAIGLLTTSLRNLRTSGQAALNDIKTAKDRALQEITQAKSGSLRRADSSGLQQPGDEGYSSDQHIPS